MALTPMPALTPAPFVVWVKFAALAEGAEFFTEPKAVVMQV
jgi:hypothetical protein